MVEILREACFPVVCHRIREWNMVSSGFCRKVTAVAAAMFCIGFCMPSPAVSAVIDDACDSAFMDKMKERAWMEAQREIMTNQKMIWKPDSVLALGCYKNWIDSMTISFTKDNKSGLNSTTSQAESYLGAAFPHTLGGGNLSGANSSNCSNIKSLWDQAECRNLSLSDIQTLKDASSNDPRKKPKSCGNPGSWGSYITNLTTAGMGAGFDKMKLFLSVTAPLSETCLPSGGGSGGSGGGSGGGSCTKKCSVGIPTGVMIGGGSNPEIVCPNPGCSPDGAASPKCCDSTSSGSSCSAAYSAP